MASSPSPEASLSTNAEALCSGAVGVSGDGVDQDDTVAKGAVTGAGFLYGSSGSLAAQVIRER